MTKIYVNLRYDNVRFIALNSIISIKNTSNFNEYKISSHTHNIFKTNAYFRDLKNTVRGENEKKK